MLIRNKEEHSFSSFYSLMPSYTSKHEWKLHLQPLGEATFKVDVRKYHIQFHMQIIYNKNVILCIMNVCTPKCILAVCTIKNLHLH